MASTVKQNSMKLLNNVLHRKFSDIVSKFNSLKVGDAISKTKKITKSDIDQFSIISGDNNVIHSTTNAKTVVHGAFLNALVSGIIGTELPGHGSLVLKQTLNYPNKCYCDETVKITVEVVKMRKIMEVKYDCIVEEENKVVLYGDAKLMFNK